MKQINHIIFLFILFCITAHAYTQEYAYAHYDTRDGLPSSVVYDAKKDKDGFMWFATETGLSRFDGSQFRNFTLEDGLPDNEILKLFVDSKNRIWMMPYRNTICYYYHGKIHTQANDSLLKSIHLANPVISMAEDAHGNVLIMETNGTYLVRADGTCKQIQELKGKEFSNIRAGLNSRGNFTYTTTALDDFILYEVVNGKPMPSRSLFEFTPNSPSSMILSPDLEAMGKKQRLFVSTPSYNFNLPLPENFISLSRLPGNTLAVNTATGSFMYNTKNGAIIDTFADGRSISAVAEDHEGNWWFCTLGQGVYRLISSGFQNFSFAVKDKPSPVYSITSDGSVHYFGSDKFRVIALKDGHFTTNYFSMHTTVGRITALIKRSAGAMVIGTDHGLLFYKNGKKQAELPALSVKSLWQNGNELLVAGHTGTYSINMTDIKKDTVNRQKIDTLWRERSGCAWKIGEAFYIGTLKGLYCIDKNESAYLGDSDIVFSRRINTMTEDKNGMLWIGTYGAGVAALKNKKLVRIISEKDGLTSNNCRAMYTNGNELWIGTDKGLNKVLLGPQLKITRFTIADGLASDIINTIYVEGTTVYVGTAEGLTRFNERNIVQRSTCILKLTGIRTGSTTWTYDTANFILPNNNRQLRFEFSGISYKSAGDITYYFRLEGLNNEWQSTRSPFLSYASLPSGFYRFQCYAVNKYGIKSNTISIPFQVEQLLWEKWWFRVLAGIVLAALIWMYVSYRIRTIRKREQAARQMDKRMTELEQMALKAQMNPHFIFNSLNSIQQYVLENDFKGVNNFITGFASLIRQTLQLSSKHKVSLEEELNYISTYLRLEKMRLEDKFTYEINVSPEIMPSDYSISPLILQPCLENSIRHGIRYRKDKDGKITVNVLKDADYLICIVEDNGVGRKLAAEYKGNRHIEYQSKGMSLTAGRIEMLSVSTQHKPSVDWADIIAENGSVAGTKVIIRLPLADVS